MDRKSINRKHVQFQINYIENPFKTNLIIMLCYFLRALSMSDNLSKLAQRIDFSKVDEDTKQQEAEIKSEEESKEPSPNVPISGWIDSVVSKLK